MAKGEDKKKTNPHGANQSVPDPRQASFLAYYIDPKSETHGNAYKSALKAGFEETYAKNIMNLMPKWLSEKLEDNAMLFRAERNFKQVQDLDVLDADGKVETNVLRERNKVDIFIAETLGKKKYSKKVEVSVSDFTGEDLEDYN